MSLDSLNKKSRRLFTPYLSLALGGEIVPFMATTGVSVDSQQWSRPSSLATGEVPRAKLLDLNGKINFLDTGSAVLGQIRVY